MSTLRFSSIAFLAFTLVQPIYGCGSIESNSDETDELREAEGKTDQLSASKLITVTEKKNNKTITSRVGDTIEIRLDGNPTTGYEWKVVQSSRSLPVSHSEYIPMDPTFEGSGGTYLFTVKPDSFAAGGTHAIKIAYFRSWEGPEAASKTFTIKIKVLPGNKPTVRTIDETMDNQTITASVGDKIEVRLEGNPTTGYDWKAVSYSRSLPVSHSDYIPMDPTFVGSGGTYVFTIVPDQFASGGSHTIKFAYFRSWEGEDKALKTFTINIDVL
jgi:inhibitor of cysteine peptidase